MKSRAHCCCLALAALLIARSSSADNISAQALFEEGRQLKDAGNCGSAIPKFEASHRLEPAAGTLLNLADCYEQLGRNASAWGGFSEAASIARRQGDERRGAYAEGRAARLAPSLSRVRIVVDDPVEGLVVERGKTAIDRATWDTAVPVDPGAIEIAARAPGYEPWRTQIAVRDPGEIEVRIPPLVPLPAPPEVEPPPRGLSPQAMAGWAAIGLSGGALVAGIALGARAQVVDDASLSYCPERPDLCLPEGAALRDEARDLERGAIVVLAAGAATAALGVVLLFTDVAVAPVAGPGQAGVSVGFEW